MGLQIYANGSKEHFDCGYIGFAALRNEIAKCIDSEFGEAYGDFCAYSVDPKEWANKMNKLIEEKNLTCNGALDFLFQSDAGGKVDYRACREILEIIQDVDFGSKYFQYGAYAFNDYERFKAFLKECVRHRRYMRWD